MRTFCLKNNPFPALLQPLEGLGLDRPKIVTQRTHARSLHPGPRSERPAVLLLLPPLLLHLRLRVHNTTAGVIVQLKQPPRRIRNDGLLASSLHLVIKLPGSLRFRPSRYSWQTKNRPTAHPSRPVFPTTTHTSPRPSKSQSDRNVTAICDLAHRLSELISFCDPLRRDRWSRQHVGHPARPPPHRTRTVPCIPYVLPPAVRYYLTGTARLCPPIIDRRLRKPANSLALSLKPRVQNSTPFLF